LNIVKKERNEELQHFENLIIPRMSIYDVVVLKKIGYDAADWILPSQ